MSDWLDTAEPELKAGLPAVVSIPMDFVQRTALFESCWSKLSDKQRAFLIAWRENRYNAVAASRALGGQTHRKTHERWLEQPEYATVVRIWRGVVADSVMDRDRLLARQDDIVETLLTPKPVLHQGIAVLHNGMVLEEVEAGAASRANEVLMKAAGLLKDKEVEVNVGVVVGGPPTLNIQVMPQPPGQVQQRESVAIDAKYTEVPGDGEADDWFSA